ncbi:MAG: aminotransferase class I/II-fold pyridoxal phosphate-dependent enzyme [Planctomycetes bacterium]|nr:aminotransferase class I/II-fold pyridoxal phosphate-dependent enzyme [Planctomycetota bacterium]
MPVSSTLAPFGTSIFAEMTGLAMRHQAINLSQGFPDFDGPDFLKVAAVAAIRAGHNQYARSFGVPALNAAIARDFTTTGGYTITDPDTHITITSGCTEALPATILGLINPGDEVILIEPFYDSYPACIALARATPRVLTLRPDKSGTFALDPAELEAAFNTRTRAILLNTPHNPTGKVFSQAELSHISSLCIKHNVLCIVDEVYEKLVYSPALPHLHIASFPGMAERTITLSSLGKSFSVTGWKIGWAIAPPHLTAGVRAAHQFLTFATSTPMQHAAAHALASPDGAAYLKSLIAQYAASRDQLAAALTHAGFIPHRTDGTYFIMADASPVISRLAARPGLGHIQDDITLCRWMTEHLKVAAIPPTAFYINKAHGRHFVRFAFCKKPETLAAAAERLNMLCS